MTPGSRPGAAAPWSGVPQRPVVLWAPYRYGVFSWLQSQDQQIAETVAFLRGELLKGTTDGSAVPAGQIGEFLQWQQDVAYPTGLQVEQVTLGTLPPGNWDVWAYVTFSTQVNDAKFATVPRWPSGFSNPIQAFMGLPGASEFTLNASTVQALTTQPTPIVIELTTNDGGAGPAAGDASVTVAARRRR